MYRAGQLQRHWWQKTLAVPSLRRYAPVLRFLSSPFTASAGPRTLSLSLSLSIFSLVRPSFCIFSCSSSYFSWILVSPSPKFLLASSCFRLCACVSLSRCVCVCVCLSLWKWTMREFVKCKKCNRDSWAQRPKVRSATAPEAD
jgi:hypothetical protein